MSSAVCYRKSIRSVVNFWQYGGLRFTKKIKWPPKFYFSINGCEMSILTNNELRIMNLLRFGRFDALVPVKMAEMSKLRCGAAGRAQQAKPAVPQARLQAKIHGCFDNLFSG